MQLEPPSVNGCRNCGGSLYAVRRHWRQAQFCSTKCGNEYYGTDYDQSNEFDGSVDI